MAQVNKVEAYIKMAEAIDKGDITKISKMERIIDKSLDEDFKNGFYSSKIYVNRKDKKIFSTV